jgi:hypothetical protein
MYAYIWKKNRSHKSHGVILLQRITLTFIRVRISCSFWFDLQTLRTVGDVAVYVFAKSFTVNVAARLREISPDLLVGYVSSRAHPMAHSVRNGNIDGGAFRTLIGARDVGLLRVRADEKNDLLAVLG